RGETEVSLRRAHDAQRPGRHIDRHDLQDALLGVSDRVERFTVGRPDLRGLPLFGSYLGRQADCRKDALRRAIRTDEQESLLSLIRDPRAIRRPRGTNPYSEGQWFRFLACPVAADDQSEDTAVVFLNTGDLLTVGRPFRVPFGCA